MDVKEYTVTQRAGPKVAGRPVEAGEPIFLTEAEARNEILNGAILPKGRSKDPLEGTKQLKDIHARALGYESAADLPPAEEEEVADVPAKAGAEVAKPEASKPAASSPAAAKGASVPAAGA